MRGRSLTNSRRRASVRQCAGASAPSMPMPSTAAWPRTTGTRSHPECILGREQPSVFGAIPRFELSLGDENPKRFGLREQQPRRTLVENSGNVDLFGVDLPNVAGRVRGPHDRRQGERRREDPMTRRIVWNRRHVAVRGVAEDPPQLGESQVLQRVQVGHLLATSQLRPSDRRRLAPGLVGRPQSKQRVHERVAARQRHADAVGLQFHLPRQRPLGHDDQPKKRLDDRPNRPQEQSQDPSDHRDAHLDVRDDLQQAVDEAAADDDPSRDALSHVHPSAHRHGPLREVSELVGEDRLELGQRERVDQTDTDDQALARGKQQAEQTGPGADRCTDVGLEDHLVGPRRASFVRDAMNEGKQRGLIGGGHLDLVCF